MQTWAQMRLSVGGDEWEETRLVLLGELFGTNAWLTEGTEGAGEEWHKVRKISTITVTGMATLIAEI